MLGCLLSIKHRREAHANLVFHLLYFASRPSHGLLGCLPGNPCEILHADFEGGGCGTLTDMFNAQGPDDDGPLYVLDENDQIIEGATAGTGRWLLTRNLRVVENSALLIHGTSIGGDTDVLRIESTSSDYYELRGYGGSLSFHTTKVTSWDTDNDEEREWDGSGRSFINCVTQYDDSEIYSCDGRSNQEHGTCRMVREGDAVVCERLFREECKND